MEGYIRLWRKIMEEPFYKNPKNCHIAIHLILIANHKDNTFLFNNQEVTILRGQALSGRGSLSLSSGISEQSCRSALTYLKRVGFITIKPTNKYSIITVNKYDDYQGNQPAKQKTNNQQITNKQPTDNQQITTNNNDNNDNNVKNEKNTPIQQFDFELVWKQYPRRLGKKESIRHFNATVHSVEDYEKLQVAISKYKAYITKNKTESQFIRHGSTFFNNWQEWLDYVDPKEAIENKKAEEFQKKLNAQKEAENV